MRSAWCLAFLLGACSTVAVQAVASGPGARAVDDNSSGQPTELGQRMGRVVELVEAPRLMAPSGQAAVRMLARGDNAFIGRLEMAPGAEVPVHRDETEEYIVVLEGEGTITIDGQRFDLRPGSTVFMPARAEVSYINGDDQLIAIQVFAGPEPADKYAAWAPDSP